MNDKKCENLHRLQINPSIPCPFARRPGPERKGQDFRISCEILNLRQPRNSGQGVWEKEKAAGRPVTPMSSRPAR
jgi:hypothetical protein